MVNKTENYTNKYWGWEIRQRPIQIIIGLGNKTETYTNNYWGWQIRQKCIGRIISHFLL